MQGADAFLRLLGMAARAGAIVPGTERVREAVDAGLVRLVVVAEDGSINRRAALLPVLKSKRIPHAVRYGRADLGAAVGRAPLGAVGVTSAPLADKLSALLDDVARVSASLNE